MFNQDGPPGPSTKQQNMKSDINGCSTCAAGKENYEKYHYGFKNKKTAYQYDYRHTDGELFSCCAPTLEACRERRDAWLANKQ